MLILKPDAIRPSAITPKDIWHGRRKFMAGAAALVFN